VGVHNIQIDLGMPAANFFFLCDDDYFLKVPPFVFIGSINFVV
jgi:hypothetical protein